MRTGTVVAFDVRRGLGTVRGDDGTEHAFHCTAITDGTRTIDAGTRVRYTLVPRIGTYEAARLTRLRRRRQLVAGDEPPAAPKPRERRAGLPRTAP
ncbi:MAG: cold shock domain-containing protein [Acidimicrobiia bacterium]|nr:cold shock domain-containing protein [Acidimicrobiia bacterium]